MNKGMFVFLLAIVMFVCFVDDGFDDRWCEKTYPATCEQ